MKLALFHKLTQNNTKINKYPEDRMKIEILQKNNKREIFSRRAYMFSF